MDALHPHGDYTAYIDGRLMVGRVAGTWNEEMQRESWRVATPLALQLNAAGPWGYVAELVTSLVFVQSVLDKSVQWVGGPAVDQLVATAWAIPPHLEGYKLLVNRYRTAYGARLPCEVFDTLEQAKAWTNARVSERLR